MWSKDDINFIFEVIFFIVFFIRVDLRVGEVDAEVEKVFILVEKGLYLFGWGAGARRVCVVVAGGCCDDVLRVGIGGVLSIEIERCV